MRSREKNKGKRKLISLIIIFVLTVGIIGAVGSKIVLTITYPKEQVELVEKYAALYGVDENLLYALIKTESGFDADAQSAAGAIGLTQITEDTFSWLLTKTGEEHEFSDLYDPETSVKYGALFISMLIEEFDDVPTALAAYHAGRGQVNRWLSDSEISEDGKTLSNIPFSDTSHYVYKVTRAVNIYNNLYD